MEPDQNNAAERSDPGPIQISRDEDRNSFSDDESESLLPNVDDSLDTLRRELITSLPGQNISRSEHAFPLRDPTRVHGFESPSEPLLGRIAPYTSPDESVSPLDSPCSGRSCLLGDEPSPKSSPELTPVRAVSRQNSTDSLLHGQERGGTRPAGDESIHNSQEHVDHDEYGEIYNGYSHIPNDETGNASNASPHADHHERDDPAHGRSRGRSDLVYNENQGAFDRYRDHLTYDSFNGFDGRTRNAGLSYQNNPYLAGPSHPSNVVTRGAPSSSQYRGPYVDSEETTYINDSQRSVRHNGPWPTPANPALQRVEREYFDSNPEHQRSRFLDREASGRPGLLGNRPAAPVPGDPMRSGRAGEINGYYPVRVTNPVNPAVYKKVDMGHLRWINKQNATGPEIIKKALDQPHISCYESSDDDVEDWFPDGRRTVWKKIPGRRPPPQEEAPRDGQSFPPTAGLPSVPPEGIIAASCSSPPQEESPESGRRASQVTTVSHPGSTITTVDDILQLSREADEEAADAKASHAAIEATTRAPSRASYDLGFQELRQRANVTRIPPKPVNTSLVLHNPRPISSVYSQDDAAVVDKTITGILVGNLKSWIRWPTSIEPRKKTTSSQPSKQSFAAFDVDDHPKTCSCSNMCDNRPSMHTPFTAYFNKFDIGLEQGRRKQLFGVGGWLENTAAIPQKDSQSEKTISFVFKKTMNKVAELKSMTQNLVASTTSDTRNSRIKVNPAKVTLRPREQGLVLGEIEIMLTEAMSFFLNREDTRHLVDMTKMKHINDQWIAEGNPIPVFFRYNLLTQINICFAHLHKFIFYSPARNNPAAVAGVLTAARQIARVLSVRSFGQPDSVLAKLIIDSRTLLLLTDEKENAQRLKDLDEVARFFYCIVHREAVIRAFQAKRMTDHNEILQAQRNYRLQNPLALTSEADFASPCDNLEKGPYFDYNGQCGVISAEAFEEAVALAKSAEQEAQLYMEGKTAEAREAGLFGDRYPATSHRHSPERPFHPLSRHKAAGLGVAPPTAVAPQLDTVIPGGALTFDSPRNTMTNRVFKVITDRSQANVADIAAVSHRQHHDELTDVNDNHNFAKAVHDSSYNSLDGTSDADVYTDANTHPVDRPDSPVLGAHPNVSFAVNPNGFSQVPPMGMSSGFGSGSKIGLAISHDATRSANQLSSPLSRLEPAATQSVQDVGSQSRWSYGSNDRDLEAALATPQTPSMFTRAARRIASHKSLRSWIGEQNSTFN